MLRWGGRWKSMSESMQARRQRGSRGEKFVEGRLKLSTSCVECHRRKQKCDQKQPCRNCSRRYPPPQCIYRTKDNGHVKVLPDDNLQAGASKEQDLDLGERLGDLRASTSDDGRQWHSGQDVVGFMDLSSTTPTENEDLLCRTISVDSLEKFDARDYQNLLNSMVSSMTSSAFNTASNPDVMLLWPKQSELRHSAGPRKSPLQKEMKVLGDKNLNVVPAPSRFSITSVDPLHFLGIEPTVKSSELLQAFMKLITRYVVSIDGNPAPNYYNDYWVPWAVKSPLLAYLGILIAACYQAEAQKTNPGQSALVLHYKLKSLSLLNEMLSKKETATCNEAIAGVMYLVTNEWYWSTFETVQAHMRGLREMVRLRGGLEELGMRNFLKTMILLTDYHITVSYNCEPYFKHETSCPAEYPPYMGSPLLHSEWTFASHSKELRIGTESAVILDDMQFMLKALLDQVNQQPTTQETTKLETTSKWIQQRILALPDEIHNSSGESPDYIYISCRLAALIYCKAIVKRESLAKACTVADLDLLWANMWKINLTRWKQIPGIFLFIILAAIQAAQNTPHGRFLKSMLKTTSSYISLEHWDVVDGSLMAFVELQRWLRNGSVEVVGQSTTESLEFFHIYGK